MVRVAARILLSFFVFLLIFMCQKPIFIGIYAPIFSDITASELWSVIWHGIPMDCSMAGYLTVIPAICAIASIFSSSRVINTIQSIYFGLMSIAISLIIVADLSLYGYWGYRLDMTPVFYFITSPTAALASATWWQIVLGVVAVSVLSILIFCILKIIPAFTPVVMPRGRSRVPDVITGVLLTLLLFIPIRGGLTVSTMNLSSAYFSSNQRLNHAAINPAFSLLYSATHQYDFETQYHTMNGNKAEELFESLSSKSNQTSYDSTLLTVDRPDICFVILESFSSHLMPSLGGEPIALRLDSIAQEGILFSNFYANSFRTDRALPAILSGWPGQPSTSIMKYAKKVESLPSWPRELANNGYKTNYYYGGDINFTNMLAYLVSSGFENIIKDSDFPIIERTGKWGAHDHLLFRRAFADMKARDDYSDPVLSVIQTSSSHEPFEVPYNNARMPSPQANAFAFADSCLGNFVDSLKTLPYWNRTLLIIVPDHYGAWPRDLEKINDRHHIPFVLTGGALRTACRVDSLTASQTDIAATLLGLLGIPAADFEFSNNLFSPEAHRQAFLADPSVVTLVTDSATVSWNCDADKIVESSGHSPLQLTDYVKAYLQILYQRISEL